MALQHARCIPCRRLLSISKPYLSVMKKEEEEEKEGGKKEKRE